MKNLLKIALLISISTQIFGMESAEETVSVPSAIALRLDALLNWALIYFFEPMR